jgi:hypothetical protein
MKRECGVGRKRETIHEERLNENFKSVLTGETREKCSEVFSLGRDYCGFLSYGSFPFGFGFLQNHALIVPTDKYGIIRLDPLPATPSTKQYSEWA